MTTTDSKTAARADVRHAYTTATGLGLDEHMTGLVHHAVSAHQRARRNALETAERVAAMATSVAANLRAGHGHQTFGHQAPRDLTDALAEMNLAAEHLRVLAHALELTDEQTDALFA